MLCLVTINSIVLESFYLYSKTQTVRGVYDKINNYYNLNGANSNIEEELQRIAFNNNFDIFIETDQNVMVFSTNKDFYSILDIITNSRDYSNVRNNDNVIYTDDVMRIEKINDQNNNISYILLSGRLDNGYSLYISIPAVPIEESVDISNQALIIIGLIILIISAFIASYISKKFTRPIVELNDITNKMARLDFSKKYNLADTDDEINFCILVSVFYPRAFAEFCAQRFNELFAFIFVDVVIFVAGNDCRRSFDAVFNAINDKILHCGICTPHFGLRNAVVEFFVFGVKTDRNSVNYPDEFGNHVAFVHEICLTVSVYAGFYVRIFFFYVFCDFF